MNIVHGQITSESIYGRCYLTEEALLLDDVSQVDIKLTTLSINDTLCFQDVRFNPTTDMLNSKSIYTFI